MTDQNPALTAARKLYMSTMDRMVDLALSPIPNDPDLRAKRDAAHLVATMEFEAAHQALLKLANANPR